jgi:DNA-binding transcriptional ArsR family regulator
MTESQTPYDALRNTFHEPNRLAILSVLCATDGWVTFTELRDQCGLTDGNLNRHLKVLEDSDIVRIRKKFVENKPQTTVAMSGKGLERFNGYLAALEQVLVAARKAVPAARESRGQSAMRVVEA